MHHAPLPFCQPETVGFCPDRTANLMRVLQTEVDSQRLPGAVALIARKGQVLLNARVGQQIPENSSTGATPMALDSIFRIYSMTKPIVSVAVMMLMEQGKLLLSDPVAKHLPEFAGVQVGRTAVFPHGAARAPPPHCRAVRERSRR
jgi:CubicO group peptidase (beta-lactamase class C family)